MRKIRLNESDIRYMVHKAINEIMAYEDLNEPAHDKYYFRCGWDQSYGGSNPFTAEGPIGGNFEEFVEQLKKYVAKKLQDFEGLKGANKRAFDSFLAKSKERHGKFSKPTQMSHERKIRTLNQDRGASYPEHLNPNNSDVSMYDDYLKRIDAEDEYNKKWLERELKISVEMPTGEANPDSLWSNYGWKRYAQTGPKSVEMPIDPENIEAAAKKAWTIFNDYAKKTPEVIGWFLWQWSTFVPTLRPILTPEVGEIITKENDEIQRFYDSLGYKGD